MAEVKVNTESEFITNRENLVIGRTYAWVSYEYNSSGPPTQRFTPVKILKQARHGTDGSRVECSDGINRYQNGGYKGKHRADQHTKCLYYVLNPNYIPALKPHVQLSLFDFETESS